MDGERTSDFHVLVVAPDEIGDRIATELKSRVSPGVSISAESSAATSLKKVLDGSADCVVSTAALPDADWQTLLRDVRKHCSVFPFILFPVEGFEDLATKALEATVTEYLPQEADASIPRLANRIQQLVPSDALNDPARGQSLPLREAIDEIDEIFYLFDDEGNFIYWNETATRVSGYQDQEIDSMSPTDFFEGDCADAIMAAIEETLQDGRATVEAKLQTKTGAEIPHEFRGVKLTDSTGDCIGVCGIGRDISERIRREQTLRDREHMLTTLHEATPALVNAETSEDIARVAVDTAEEVLDLPGVAVYLFDSPMGELRPTAHSDTVDELIDEVPRISDGVVWEAYVAEETKVFEDIREKGPRGEWETPIRSLLVVPMGNQGVFLAADTFMNSFGEFDIDFTELLASTVKVSLDRAEHEQVIRERDAELDRRNTQLERLNRVNTVIRDIDRALVEASTKSDILEEVCDRLVAIDALGFAWVGDSEEVPSIQPQSWAGDSSAYLDQLSEDQQSNLPATTVARTRESVIISDLFDDRRAKPWRQTALNQGYRSVISVPITYQEASYGVLEVYSERIDVFDEETGAVLSELGETIGHAINAISRKDALLGSSVVQLEFELSNESDLCSQVARQLDRSVEITAFIPQADGTYQSYVPVEESAKESFRQRLEQSTTVSDVAVVAEHGDSVLYRCHVTGSTMATTIADYGGVPRQVRADADTERIVADLPSEIDVGAFVETIEDHFPGAELVARRHLSGDQQTLDAYRDAAVESLTDRQQDILQVAYASGFYEWPRDATGEDLAEAIDIAPSTLHQHLRSAHRKLAGTLLNGSSG